MFNCIVKGNICSFCRIKMMILKILVRSLRCHFAHITDILQIFSIYHGQRYDFDYSNPFTPGYFAAVE